jgi:bacterioferritin-associated ferredoxin
MRDRTIVCPCEDVELHELEEAIERGYTSLEPLKRATAVTTGPCQGKWCLSATIRVLAEATDTDPEAIGGITHRQPVRGVPLAAIAQAPADDEDATGGPDDPEEA